MSHTNNKKKSEFKNLITFDRGFIQSPLCNGGLCVRLMSIVLAWSRTMLVE